MKADSYNDWQRTLTFQAARKIVIAVVGFTLLVLGVAMIVLPGPALLVIPLGLALLATEFVWAKRWLERMRNLITLGKDLPLRNSAESNHEEHGHDCR